MLRIERLTYRIGGHTILDGASVDVPSRAKVALIGRNGAGKTTLLRLIQRQAEPDGGSIELPRNARIATVAQEAPDGSGSLIETVLAADRERAEALAGVARAEAEGDAEGIGLGHARLQEIEAHSAPARAAEILAGLGFSQDEMSRPCASFSGGWRMRVALAAALVQRPDILLLDEPSNHLDFEAAAWLESHLAKFSGMLILVSHDRAMLDRVAERIVHLDEGKLTDYRGNYTAFERAYAARRAARRRENESLLAQQRHMQAFVDRFRAKATKARQAQSRLKALERLGPITPVTERRPTVLDFPEPDALAPPLITLDRVAVGYDDTTVLRGLDLRIDMDDRIALLGPNGNGKSTLIRLLGKRLAPSSGDIHRSSKLRIGYFAQHQMEELDPAGSAYDHLRRLDPDRLEPALRAHLGRFGLAQDKADISASELSGGEKARLLLAIMCRGTPHLLLLDEPTNHLDIDARAALIHALNTFPGAVVIVSHDPFLIDHVADRLWLLGDGTCRPFEGDLDDYRRHVLEADRKSARETRGRERKPGRKAERRQAAAARQALAPLRKAVREAETRIERLRGELAAVDAKLADPAPGNGGGDRLGGLLKRQGGLRKDLESAESGWIAAVEALEAGTPPDLES